MLANSPTLSRNVYSLPLPSLSSTLLMIISLTGYKLMNGIFRLVFPLNLAHGYIRYYYQYREDRLCACPLVVHGLLHTVPDIRFCGPSWTTWTFYMERYCGFLKTRLRSRKFPWANLNNTVLSYAYLEQLGVRYDLSDELAIFGRRKTGPSQSEKTFDHCEQIRL